MPAPLPEPVEVGVGAHMDILITDVTEMGQDNYCVAGWDTTSKRMIRPLPNGGNWTASLMTQHGIVAGKLISVEPRGKANGIYPHLTEDARIDLASIKTSDGVFSDWHGESAPHVAASMSAGFGGHLRWNKEWNGVREGVYAHPGVQCGSLVAVRVPKANVAFSEAFGKLQATLNDGSDSYQLTVSSKVLKEAWRTCGLLAVKNALPATNEFHVRVGLARPFGNPLKCYAMLNGIL
jgi:hypothetical protein